MPSPILPGSSIHNLKRKILEERLQSLYKKYETVYSQLLSSLNASEKLTIRSQIELIEQQIRDIENDLNEIGINASQNIQTIPQKDKQYDVFLCHNSSDKQHVRKIANLLRERGILPWLDEWELRPGTSWQETLQGAINNVRSVAIFVGSGYGPWQQVELRAFLREFVKKAIPIIPVILENVEEPPTLPAFLQGFMWVDFRKKEPDPLESLIWGITGNRDKL